MATNVFGFDFDKDFEYENGFYLTSNPPRLYKALSHYELYKQITHLPGEIVECGVYKGASLIRFATFREMLETEHSRKIIGFDAFGKFPAVDNADDLEFVNNFEKIGGDGISRGELLQILQQKGFGNVDLVAGDVCETLPKYLEQNKNLKIALLFVDVDVYHATKCVLEHLWDCVVGGGIVVFDDYTVVKGANTAVDEFLQQRGIDAPIKKLPYYRTPSYLIKTGANVREREQRV